MRFTWLLLSSGLIDDTPYKAPRKISVLLLLRKYRDLLSQEKPPTLPELILKNHVSGLPGAADLQLSLEWAKGILKRGDAVVMLDGFDEVAKSQRPAVARWINEQMRQYGKSIFIVTSRPKAYNEQPAGDRLELNTVLWVRDFNADQRKAFVEQWYFCQERYASGGRDDAEVRSHATSAANDLLSQIEARQELKDLAKNPLLLNMIVTFHRRYPSAELPKRRVELYREICLLQLRDRPGARKLDTLLTQCDAQVILQMLALDMMQKKQERCDKEALLQQLTRYLMRQAESVQAKDFLDQVVQISELLVEREPEEYEFAHLSLQEYLAATEILRLKQESLLYERFKEDWWKQTILLYAAQTNPGSLIRAAIDRGATDLAYTCYQETTKRLDPALQAELQTLKPAVQVTRYQQLEEFLRNQQWQEADYETYLLMITTVGKEEGQWFDKEELLNFPSEELRTIDRLWVKYSGGRFGFSVQKNIYLECGGIPDGKYYEEAWEKFAHTVGWKKGGDYIPYSEYIFSLSAPKGHLPKCYWRVGVGVLVLFSRIETCES